jgi:hypothetical protein
VVEVDEDGLLYPQVQEALEETIPETEAAMVVQAEPV